MDTSSHASLVAKWTESLKPAEVRLRLATESDSEFIFQLRNDPELAKHLSPTKPDLGGQRQWMRDYALRHQSGKENYFVIEHGAVSVGTIRMYDYEDPAGVFTWGSWIIKRHTPPHCALRSVLLLYDFGFRELGFHEARFDVRKENASVLLFHRRLGAVEKRQSDRDVHFSLTKSDYDLQARNRLLQLHDKVS
jgi:RimJ/RimL family protein N-acetyltransferase